MSKDTNLWYNFNCMAKILFAILWRKLSKLFLYREFIKNFKFQKNLIVIFQKPTREEDEVVEQLLDQVLRWVQMSRMNLKPIKLQPEAQDHGKNLDELGAQLIIPNLPHQVLRVIYIKLYLLAWFGSRKKSFCLSSGLLYR